MRAFTLFDPCTTQRCDRKRMAAAGRWTRSCWTEAPSQWCRAAREGTTRSSIGTETPQRGARKRDSLPTAWSSWADRPGPALTCWWVFGPRSPAAGLQDGQTADKTVSPQGGALFNQSNDFLMLYSRLFWLQLQDVLGTLGNAFVCLFLLLLLGEWMTSLGQTLVVEWESKICLCSISN